MGYKPCLSNGSEMIMYYVFLFIHATSTLSPSLFPVAKNRGIQESKSLFLKKNVYEYESDSKVLPNS